MSERIISIKKSDIWKYSTFLLAALVVVLVIVMTTGNRTGTQIITTAQQGNSVAGNIAQANIEIGDAPVIGDENAPVTVIKFSDFSCPFCAAASGDNAEMVSYMKSRSPSWEPIVTNLMKDYVETGKVRFAVKYMMGHSGGHSAQLVAWCLYEEDPDLYWSFYSKAFENIDDVEDLNKMKALAGSINGVDVGKLQTCLDSGKFDARFTQEQNEGRQAGAQGTPAFFVNGKLVSGAVPYSQMKQTIDAALAAA